MPIIVMYAFDLLMDGRSNSLMACLEVKKRRGSRVEGGRVIQLPYLEVFSGMKGRSLEGFQPPLTSHF